MVQSLSALRVESGAFEGRSLGRGGSQISAILVMVGVSAYATPEAAKGLAFRPEPFHSARAHQTAEHM